MSFELAIGTIHGVRAFEVDRLGRLNACHADYVWTPGENVARCRSCPPKEIPRVACSCGFYSFYQDEDGYETHGRIAGVIEAYGRTIIGENGFRAQKAKIVALCIPHPPKPPSGWWPWVAYGRLFSTNREGSRASNLFGVHLISVFAFGVAAFCCSLTSAPSWIWQLCAALVVLNINACIALEAYAGTGRGGSRSRFYEGDTKQMAAVRRNYPDVTFFSSRKAMLNAYPMREDELEPAVATPETDADFWTREV